MIQFLLFAILVVIFWPVALIVGLIWLVLVILRVVFVITVSIIKAAAATGVGSAHVAMPLVERWTWPRKVSDGLTARPWMHAFHRLNARLTGMPPPP